MLIDRKLLIITGVAAVFSFFSGIYITRNIYEAKIAEYLKNTAEKISELEQKKNVELSKVIAERDDAYSRVSDIDDRNRDLVKQLHNLRSRITSASERPVISYEKEYDRCRKLLSESYAIIIAREELLAEGCRKFGKCAADKDAIAELIQSESNKSAK